MNWNTPFRAMMMVASMAVAMAMPVDKPPVASAIAHEWPFDAQQTLNAHIFGGLEGGKLPDHSLDYEWTGKVWGMIEPSGVLLFDSANGCTIRGKIVQRGNLMIYEGKAKITSCNADQLNKDYHVFINLNEQNELVMTFSYHRDMVGRFEFYEFKTNLGLAKATGKS